MTIRGLLYAADEFSVIYWDLHQNWEPCAECKKYIESAEDSSDEEQTSSEDAVE